MTSKTKKPKRKYDPTRWQRTIAQNAVSRALRERKEAEARAGAMNLTDEALQDLGLAYHSAFEMMIKHGGEEPFHTLAAAINIAGRFCEMGVGDEYADDVEAAIVALKRVRERALRTGRWALDGDAIKCITRALQIHDAQMESVSYDELRRAIEQVYAMNESQLAAEALPKAA
jgi:hypothetical protein